MVHITTESGSEYVLDHKHNLWERTNVSEKSGKLRTVSGSFHSASYAVGQALRMVCAPLVAHTSLRFIQTSLIVSVVTKAEEKQHEQAV